MNDDEIILSLLFACLIAKAQVYNGQKQMLKSRVADLSRIKVFLNKRETCWITINLDESAFSYYKVNEKLCGFVPGHFAMWIARSSEQVELKKNIKIK